MARWKLATSHYLNTVKPVKWRYQETDRSSGENLEKEFIVPRLLDIADPAFRDQIREEAAALYGGGRLPR